MCGTGNSSCRPAIIICNWCATFLRDLAQNHEQPLQSPLATAGKTPKPLVYKDFFDGIAAGGTCNFLLTAVCGDGDKPI